MSAAVVVRDLGVEFQLSGGTGVTALRDVSLSVEPGQFVSILGPSGCGKTTLLRVLAGLEHATNGRVSIAGGNDRKDGARVGMVFQRPILLPWRSILQNVLLPIQVTRRVTDADRARARALLEMVGLEDFETSYPNQLSGGMQQRAAICRALITGPELLLLDEPFGALDAMTRDNLNVELNRIWRETGKTIILITHSISEAVFLSERVLVMSHRPGRVVDEVDVPIGSTRTLDVLGMPAFNDTAAHLRAHFEVRA
ncbi:ABC transporter ATP-binding protein [Dactylosporangium sp. NPDC000555]|uniref:ABC transporter ATP-binding protein n=1 Tax=Dactylosporangium sp. NPDC000555 TaxID=3154260 RepID=UPI003325EE8D